MRTIYAVSSGSYSDYRVQFVCESKAVAEASASALRGDDGDYNSYASMLEADANVMLAELERKGALLSALSRA